MHRRRLIAASALSVAVVTAVRAAELHERTRVAYEAYAATAQARFVAEATDTRTNVPLAREQLRSGTVLAGPGGEEGIIGVPGGLIHHWKGAIFIPDTTLDRVLDLAQSYERYPTVYPSVVAVRVLHRTGDTYQLVVRLKEQAGIVTGVLDVWSTVRYVRVSATRAYSVTASTEIREVLDAGQPNERLLPPGHGRGYLWRASTLAQYRSGDGGVYVDLETLGLSRAFPPMLGRIIEPIARRIGRKSVAGTLREFRDALLTEF
jgi:hypothetical protein